MAFSFLEPNELNDAFNEAKKHAELDNDFYDEAERVARNRPSPKIDKSYPKVTEGTLSGYVGSRPKAVVQQFPTGVVKTTSDTELASLSGFLLEEHILANANSGGTPLQKSWEAIGKALTYRRQPSYQFYTNRGDYYGADFLLPSVRDVFLEPGKKHIQDSNYVFMRGWYSEKDIAYIIWREKKLKREAKERGETYKTSWNLKLLADLKKKTKPEEAKDAKEKSDNSSASFIEIIHAFQRGVGGIFYSFDPDNDEGKLFETENKDKRGEIPIKMLDLSNTMGVGAVEISMPMQNFLDSQLSAYQYMQALMMNPPIEKRGSYDSSVLKYRPNAIWDFGNDQNASATPAKISSQAMTNFSNDFSLAKSILLNLNNTQDTSVSASAGNIAFSKTSRGVAATEERVAIQDNHIRRQYEAWFGDVCEDMLNIHFSESVGVRDYELTQEYIDKRKVSDPDFDQDHAQIDYDAVKDRVFKFKVDASTSKVKEDSDDKEALLEIIQIRSQDPELQQLIPADKLARRFFKTLGVDDVEELINTPEEAEAMLGDEMGGGVESPPEALEETQQSTEPISDPEVEDMFTDMGATPEQVQTGVQMLYSGLSSEEVMGWMQNAIAENIGGIDG